MIYLFIRSCCKNQLYLTFHSKSILILSLTPDKSLLNTIAEIIAMILERSPKYCHQSGVGLNAVKIFRNRTGILGFIHTKGCTADILKCCKTQCQRLYCLSPCYAMGLVHTISPTSVAFYTPRKSEVMRHKDRQHHSKACRDLMLVNANVIAS